MKKLIFILFAFVLIWTLTVPVSAEDVIIEEVPVVNETSGFFEGVITGMFDFVTSEEFTKLATSLSVLALAIYPFIKKYLSASAQAKYEKISKDLANSKEQINEYRDLALKYAAVADDAIKNTKAIKQSLELGFDKSNLRQDVKDKIMRELKSVPKIDAIIEAAKDTIKNAQDIITEEKEDNLLTDEPAVTSGW